VGMELEIATMSILGFACVFVGAIGFTRMVWDRVKK
jgi:multisubunit Na+/H+ antiporter MnhG subunit